MVQNLINNINTQSSTAAIGSNLSTDNSSKTDFQMLFDKQSLMAESKDPDTSCMDLESTNAETINKNTEVIESGGNFIDKKAQDNDNTAVNLQTESTSFAENFIYEIKQLMESIQSQNSSDASSEKIEDTIIPVVITEGQKTPEEQVECIAETEENPVTESTITNEETNNIDAEKIAKQLLHSDDPEIGTKKEEGEVVDIKTDETKQAISDVVSNATINSFVNNFETLTEETPAAKEISKSQKTAENGAEETIQDIIDEEQIKELNVESIEVETADSGSNDLMQHQSPEEHGLKAMLQADTDFTGTTGIENKTAQAQNLTKATSVEITSNKIIEQITKQMDNLYNGSKVNMVLNPESLGKVSIQLVNSKEGLSAQFTCATQEARDLIMKGLDGLKDTLLSHGVNIDNVSVKLNDTQESEYNADWTEQEDSGKGNKEQGSKKGQKEKENFENLMSYVQDEEN